jgi:peptide/nickel transport system ATP-binding protein
MTSRPPDRATPPGEFVRVRGLTKRYVRGGLWRRASPVTAVNHVDLDIRAGTTLALVGESGSGKSTVARCLAGLERPDSGEIRIGDTNIANRSARSSLRERALVRESVQLVFQDPTTSMNSRFTAAQVVEEPLQVMGIDSAARKQIVDATVHEVGLTSRWLNRSIMQFSGGQRQRLAIARALVVRPKLLVLDEALTGLDLSTQAQIANLLLDLQSAHSLTYLLISHDLALVSRLANAIAVISHGRIVETGPTQTIMTAPKHEETLRLLMRTRALQAAFAAISGTPGAPGDALSADRGGATH